MEITRRPRRLTINPSPAAKRDCQDRVDCERSGRARRRRVVQCEGHERGQSSCAEQIRFCPGTDECANGYDTRAERQEPGGPSSEHSRALVSMPAQNQAAERFGCVHMIETVEIETEKKVPTINKKR